MQAADNRDDTLDPLDHYSILDVSRDATEADIRRKYYEDMKCLHPDRRRPGSGSLERMHKVQLAYRCLSDPSRRLLYDLRLGISVSAQAADPAQEARLIMLQKEQAARDIENMESTLENIVARETRTRGILIRSALYGDLRLLDDRLELGVNAWRTIVVEDLVGPVLDVALPVQVLVEEHTIMLPGGSTASKGDLPGFYNPLPLNNDVELGLYVLYEFRGLLHEVIVGDREALSMPYRKHAVPAGKEPRGPFTPANIGVSRFECPRATRRSQASPSGTSVCHNNSSFGLDEHGAAGALRRSVVAYRYESLRASCKGDATTEEFFKVASVAAVIAAMALLWAKFAGRQ